MNKTYHVVHTPNIKRNNFVIKIVTSPHKQSTVLLSDHTLLASKINSQSRFFKSIHTLFPHNVHH